MGMYEGLSFNRFVGFVFVGEELGMSGKCKEV